MATLSSLLAWRVPWTEEPGGLQSMGHKESDTTETTVHACKCTNYFAWGYPKDGQIGTLVVPRKSC